MIDYHIEPPEPDVGFLYPQVIIDRIYSAKTGRPLDRIFRSLSQDDIDRLIDEMDVLNN